MPITAPTPGILSEHQNRLDALTLSDDDHSAGGVEGGGRQSQIDARPSEHHSDESTNGATCRDNNTDLIDESRALAAVTIVGGGANADLIDEYGALPVTLEDGGDALDCGVCYLPLRPPIFQCENGHVLCSSCRRKLESTGNGTCHVCRVELDDEDESRCHAMERVVESIRVACPNASRGCTARLTYYGRSSHRRTCPHAGYSCSGHGCGFVGSLGALLDHVASVHNNNEFTQQFLAEKLSRLMAKLKLRMAIADIRVMGVDPLDIEVVMSEAGVSVDKAAKALKESEGNVITAIRKLTI